MTPMRYEGGVFDTPDPDRAWYFCHYHGHNHSVGYRCNRRRGLWSVARVLGGFVVILLVWMLVDLILAYGAMLAVWMLGIVAVAAVVYITGWLVTSPIQKRVERERPNRLHQDDH